MHVLGGSRGWRVLHVGETETMLPPEAFIDSRLELTCISNLDDKCSSCLTKRVKKYFRCGSGFDHAIGKKTIPIVRKSRQTMHQFAIGQRIISKDSFHCTFIGVLSWTEPKRHASLWIVAGKNSTVFAIHNKVLFHEVRHLTTCLYDQPVGKVMM